MKNLKKFFAVVLAVAMLATLMSVPAMADTDYTDEAGYLEDMNLLRGTGGDLMLDSAPDRLQALVMLLYLTGEAETANAYMTAEAAAEYLTEQGFTDVDDVVWGDSILAYCVDEGYLYGGSGLLDAHGECTAEMFAAYMMRVIVDADDLPAWDGTSANLSALQEKGAFSVSELATFLMAGEFTRELASGMMYGTLSATIEKEDGNGKTVAQNLFDNGVIDADQAAAGNVSVAEPTPTPAPELAIESVTGLNLLQAEVVFNMEVDGDTAGAEGNYSISDGANGAIAVADATLQADNKTVVLTFDVAAGQQDELDITVEKVEDLDENALDETTVEGVEFLDTTLPTAVNAEVVGVDTIKVTFSEPIMTTGNALEGAFEVNDGDDKISGVTKQANDTEILVAIYSDLEDGEVVIKVNGDAEDYAGFGCIPKTFTLDVTEDSDAPVVVDYKDADLDSVTLIFNEDIEIGDATLTNYYHTNTNNPVDAVTVDGKELTLTFTTNNLPEGTAYVYILKESVNDLWDNDNTKIIVEIEVDVDTTAPELDDLEVNDEKNITLTFTEDLDDAAKSNFTILDSDGEEVENIIQTVTHPVGAGADADAAKVKITFKEDLNGDYSIVIEDLEDTATNVIVTVTEDFNVDDSTAPDYDDADDPFEATLYNAAAEDQLVKINFKQAMAIDGAYSVLDIEKYSINGTLLTEMDCKDDITIKAISDNKAIEIVIPSSVDDDENGVDLGIAVDGVQMARVADAAGNYTPELSFSFDLDAAGNVAIDSVEATGVNTIVVTFGDALDFEEDDIDLTVATAVYNPTVSKIKVGSDDDGNTVVTYTIEEDLNYDGTLTGGDNVDYTVTVEVAGTDSENKYGETLALAATKDAEDKIVPALAVADNSEGDEVDSVYVATVTDGVTTETAIALDFEEDMELTTFTKNSFTVDGYGVTEVWIDALDSSIIYLILDADDVTDNGDPEAGTDVSQVYGVEDAIGNLVDDISTQVDEF